MRVLCDLWPDDNVGSRAHIVRGALNQVETEVACSKWFRNFSAIDRVTDSGID